MKVSRRTNLSEAEQDSVLIEDMGIRIERFTDFHWRLNDKIDIWPSSKKFMIRDGFHKVRFFSSLLEIVPFLK